MRHIDSSYDRMAMQEAVEAQRVLRIRLPEQFYEPRRTLGGGEVRDVVPYDGAVAYVTDGSRYGILFEDGRVDWLGSDPVSAFGEGAEVVGV